MQYKVGDYLTRENTILMRVIAAIAGEFDLYALSGIKNPAQLSWYTAQELEGMGYSKVEPNLKEFYSAKIGDIVHAGGDQYLKILGKVGHALLLSQANDEMAKVMLEFVEHVKADTGTDILPKEARKALKDKTNMMKQHAHAGEWFDMDVMALMNWKLVKE